MNKTHGGKRTGAGRKPALHPVWTKKLRASSQEWREFLSYLTGDARKDFEILLDCLRENIEPVEREPAELPRFDCDIE